MFGRSSQSAADCRIIRRRPFESSAVFSSSIQDLIERRPTSARSDIPLPVDDDDDGIAGSFVRFLLTTSDRFVFRSWIVVSRRRCLLASRTSVVVVIPARCGTGG